MHRRRQHHIVARRRQRRVELHIRHVVVGVLLQPFHGSADSLQILLCGPLTGKTGNGHLVDTAKLVEVLPRVQLIGHPDKCDRLADKVRVAGHPLPVAVGLDSSQKLQDGQALPQRTPPDT